MKIKKLTDSFNYAINGIIYSIKTQRNMRIHFSAALIVLAASLFYSFSKLEILILFLNITLVIVLELINTAIEAAIDATANYYHPLAKISKNVSAGAVLISAINAVITGYLLFFDRMIKPGTKSVIARIKNSNPTVILICILIVIIITVLIKAYFGEGTPLSGGMPSGHSALAFSAATIISFKTYDTVIITLCYLLALLVSQSRIEGHIHTLKEVAAGAILGTLITIFICRIMN